MSTSTLHSHSTSECNGNHISRDDLRQALEDFLLDGLPPRTRDMVEHAAKPSPVFPTPSAATTERPIVASADIQAGTNSEFQTDSEQSDNPDPRAELRPTLLVEVKGTNSAFCVSRKHVKLRGLTLKTAVAVMADLNRDWLNCYRKDHPWHSVVRTKRTYTVVRTMVKKQRGNSPTLWRPRSVLELPNNVVWRSGAERGAINKAELAKLSEKVRTRKVCFEVIDVEELG